MEEVSGHPIACGPMWLSWWAPAEDWEAVDSSPDSIEKVLQTGSSHLLNKVAHRLQLALWCGFF